MKQLDLYDTVEKQRAESVYINRIRYDVRQLDLKLDALQLKLDSLRNSDIVEVVEVVDFFVFIESISGISGDMLRFIAQLFPAIFLDVISSVSFALILFDKKKEE